MKRILDSRPRLGTRRARAALGASLLLLAGLATTASFFPLRAVAATGHGDLAPFVGAFSGDWPADPFAAKFSGGWPVDQESRKKARALDLFIHPDGRIVRTWYKYQQAADGTATPQKVTDRVTGYTVEGNTLKIQVRVEDFAFRDRPAGVAEITETLELQGNNDGVYRMVSNSYIEDLKKRGEPVPPPPPPIPMKRGC